MVNKKHVFTGWNQWEMVQNIGINYLETHVRYILDECFVFFRYFLVSKYFETTISVPDKRITKY